MNEEDLERLKKVLADGDVAGALCFVDEVLQEKVKENELPHCVPVFDAGYNPGQGEVFKRG